MCFFPRCSKPPMTIMYMCFRWNARSSFAYNAHSTAVCGLTFADFLFLFLESSDIWSTAAIDILHTSKLRHEAMSKLPFWGWYQLDNQYCFQIALFFLPYILPCWIWPAAQKMMLFCHKFLDRLKLWNSRWIPKIKMS